MRYLILAGALALATPAVAQTVAPDTSNSSYRRGSIDRDSWEAWYGGLYGGAKEGASYWAENRSHNPIPCAQVSGSPQWMAGCNEATQRLALTDYGRLHDPQYRNGWNKKAPVVFVPGIPGEVAPPVAPPTPRYNADYCADPRLKPALMSDINAVIGHNHPGWYAVDIYDLTIMPAAPGAVVCHLTILSSSGARTPGALLEPAGGGVYWTPDASL